MRGQEMLVLPVHGPRLILSLSKAIKTVDLSGPTKAIRATKCTVLRTNCADTSQNLQPKSKPVPTIRCQILFLLPYIRSHPARSPLSYPSSDPSLWSPPRPADLEKSRIRETKHLSTDADSSTDTTVGWTKNTQKPIFFEKRKTSSKTQKLKNV